MTDAAIRAQFSPLPECWCWCFCLVSAGGGVADQTSGIVQATVGGNSLRLPNASGEFDALIGPTP